MGYGKLAKGMSQEEARRKLEKVMPVSSRKTDFNGASPPSVFIGSHSYPKVNTGVLSPQHMGDSTLMDSPSDWYQENYGIEKVASLRTSLVNSKKKLRVKDTDSFLNNTQEIAMARKPVDVEVSLQKKPGASISAGRVKPISASGDVKKFVLGENPSVDRQVEKAFYDTDATAETIVNEISEKVDVYRIQQSLSAGMLGEEDSRKLVPTRWSITATDDMVSKKLRSRVQQYQELGQIEYYRNQYVGNDFHIFLIPGRWEYELVEMKRPGSVWNAAKNTYIGENYEGFNGRTRYAEQTAGAYYAARLGALEHLDARRRQAKVLILREVTPDYWAPLGVWVIRETVRNAFNDPEVLDSFHDVKMRIGNEFKFLYSRLRQECKMLGSRQSSLANY